MLPTQPIALRIETSTAPAAPPEAETDQENQVGSADQTELPATLIVLQRAADKEHLKLQQMTGYEERKHQRGVWFEAAHAVQSAITQYVRTERRIADVAFPVPRRRPGRTAAAGAGGVPGGQLKNSSSMSSRAAKVSFVLLIPKVCSMSTEACHAGGRVPMRSSTIRSGGASLPRRPHFCLDCRCWRAWILWSVRIGNIACHTRRVGAYGR